MNSWNAVDEIAKYNEVIDELQSEIERLRKLILEAEYSGKYERWCPWCAPDGYDDSFIPTGEHSRACPAFSGPGVVR